MCRICFEETHEVGELLSPCSCIGTQQYVHFKCLRKWQESVLASQRSADDERAEKCSVCQTKFSVPPPRPEWSARMVAGLRGLGGALCISLLAFGLTGPPWPHLALMLMLLLGTRSHSLLLTAALLLGSLLATMHARGLRVVMRVDGFGRLGMVLIRHGERVEGLAPGVLLVASEELHNSIFRQSVVLVYQHSAAGASGIMLTKPLDPRRLAEYPPEDPVRHRRVRHFVGGPVGMAHPGTPALERVLLHDVPNAGAAFAVPVNITHAGAGGPQAFISEQTREMAAQLTQRPAAAPPHLLRMFHGISSWADGQLEGEIRTGGWGFVHASWDDLTAEPDQLWEQLVASPRLQWL